MCKLIRLEMKKYRIMDNWRGFAFTCLGIFAFIMMTSFSPEDLLENNEMVFIVIDTFVRIAFMVYGAVLMANIVIGEFRSQTISVMFMYPISRKKIMAAKLVIVVLFTFVSIIAGGAVLTGMYYLYNLIKPVTAGSIFPYALSQAGVFTVKALTCACVMLIPLFFGMLKKSTAATIVSGVVIVSLISSSSGNLTALSDNLYVSLALGAIGVLVAWLTVRNIDKVDVVG